MSPAHLMIRWAILKAWWHPHTVLPFVVEHAGGINKEGMLFFRMRRDAADNKLNARAGGLSSWSGKGPSNFSFSRCH